MPARGTLSLSMQFVDRESFLQFLRVFKELSSLDIIWQYNNISSSSAAILSGLAFSQLPIALDVDA